MQTSHTHPARRTPTWLLALIVVVAVIIVGWIMGEMMAGDAGRQANENFRRAQAAEDAAAMPRVHPPAAATPAPRQALPSPAPRLTRTPRAAPRVHPPGVTRAQFDALQMGMTYDQAVAVLGSPGEKISEIQAAGYHTVMYQWWGRAGGGANMNAMFQNGRLVSRAQFGLR